MPATSHARQQHRDLARTVQRQLPVVDADVVTTPDGTRTEIVLRPGVDGLPPAVNRHIVEAGFRILDCAPQGEPAHWVVEVV